VKVVALHNLKGGVGKTTAAVHLAHVLARSGRTTLLWDLDPQGAASWCFRVRPDESMQPKRLLSDRESLWDAIRGSDWPQLDVLPADLSLRKLERALQREEAPEQALAATLEELGKRYERLVLDCPPGLSLLAECVFHSADVLVVPTIPTALSLRTLAALHGHVRPHRKRGLLVLPFFSMLDSRKSQHRTVHDYVRAHGLGFLETVIPYSAHVENAAARREPLTVAGTSAPAAAFEALAREVEMHLAAGGSGPKLRRERLQGLVLDVQRNLGRPHSNGTD
jgi:chromosome partitioning protein